MSEDIAGSRNRSALALFTVAVLTLGAAALLGLGRPRLPMAGMEDMLPRLTLPTVMAAGFVDGINPCAFTALLLFVAALLATTQASYGEAIGIARGRVMRMGSIYIGAVFLTYLALGVGVLATAQVFSRAHISARVAALAAVLLGLWLLKDFFLPGWGPRLQAPARLGGLIARTGRKATVPALALGGMLIALCTVPCSGAVYLAVLALLAAQPSAAAGYGYLLVYNLVFIAPLVGILLAAGSRPALTRVKRWHTYRGRSLRLVLGALSVVLGLLILAMV